MSVDLSHHGDADLVPGLVDLAVNVRSGGTPGWLAERVRGTDLAAYPDQREAVTVVAARHARAEGEVLLTAGAAEAFVLLARVLRPRRAVVVHPQFTEPEAALLAAGHHDLTGLVVIRSLTKTWGLAGLRVGYLLAVPDTVRLLAAAQPLWAVSAPALPACVATTSPAALREAGEWATGLAGERAHLLRRLASVSENSAGAVRVVPHAAASFVLADTRVADMRARLLRRGFAVRRGETFPGLGPTWIRVAVRDAETSNWFAAALADALGQQFNT